VGGKGIDIRARSIRITFTLGGRQERRTVYLNGAPLPPSPGNIRYAERLAAEIREKIRLGTFSLAEYFPVDGDTHAGVTVADHLDTWLASLRVEQSTRAGYTSAVRFWRSLIGDKSLVGLKHSDVLRAIATRPDLTGKTVNNYVSVLREALELSVLDGILQGNPTADVPRAKHQKAPPDPFTRDETEQIIAKFSERYPGQVANLVDFWFWTGMRTSEIFGLTWANVDLNDKTTLVAEALVRGKRKSTTKTAVARLVKLNSRAYTALARQRQFTQVAGGPVFCDPRYKNQWGDERAFRRSFWTPTLKALGIRYRRPYNMRHSYATAMLMAGMTPAFCARQLGHSVEVFLRTYAKWLDGQQDDQEMERLEAGLSPSYPRKSKSGT